MSIAAARPRLPDSFRSLLLFNPPQHVANPGQVTPKGVQTARIVSAIDR